MWLYKKAYLLLIRVGVLLNCAASRGEQMAGSLATREWSAAGLQRAGKVVLNVLDFAFS
jgi:hypothetical protein